MAIRKCLIAVVCFLAAAVACAKTNTLVNGASDWSLPGSFVENRTLEPGDSVIINANCTGTVYDASAAIVSSLDRVILTTHKTACIIIDISTNTTFGCAINDGTSGQAQFGTIIKRGDGEASFTSYSRTIDDPSRSAYVRDYATHLHIEKGDVRFPDITDVPRAADGDKRYYYVPYIVMNEGTRLFTSSGAAFFLKYIDGYGLVTNDYGRTSKYDLIRVAYDTTTAQHCDFHGRIEANGYSGACIVQGNRMNLCGTESTFTRPLQTGEDTSNLPYVRTGVMKFGNTGEPSSIGTNQYIYAYASRLIYLGIGESCNKYLLFVSNLDAPAILDGGVTGGLDFTGRLYNGSGVSSALHRRIELSGDHTNACKISGAFHNRTNSGGVTRSFHITKTGKGVWHLNRDANGFLGGVAVEDGILRFNTLAAKGIECSLGLATVLTDAYAGSDVEGHAVDYAICLGGASTEGTLDHVGPAAATSAGRPMAVRSAGRIAANGGALTISDIYGLGAGAKTLTLDGSNTADNVAFDVRDGDGTLSVVKEGKGSWTIAQTSGSYGFTGALDVRGGTVKIIGDHSGQPFNRFRLWLKENAYANGAYSEYYSASDTSTRNFMIHRFALFDADGNAQTPGLAAQPTGTALAPGQYAYAFAERLYSASLTGLTGLENLLAGTGTSNRSQCRAMYDLNVNDPNTWVAIDMYMTNGTPAIKTLDYSFYYALDGGTTPPYASRQNPTAMALEGSADGLTWENVWTSNNIPLATVRNTLVISGKGIGNDTNLAKALVGNTRGARISHSYPTKSTGLIAATSFSVASNATLRTDGAALAFANGVTWRISAAGGGTLQGFTLPAEGTLDVSDLPSGASQLRLPVTCVDVSGLDNVAGWSIVSGASDLAARWSVGVRNGEIWMSRRGFCVTIK
jgi:autotransporter-associated beta strand protein